MAAEATEVSLPGFLSQRLRDGLRDTVLAYDGSARTCGTARQGGGRVVQFQYGYDGVMEEEEEDLPKPGQEQEQKAVAVAQDSSDPLKGGVGAKGMASDGGAAMAGVTHVSGRRKGRAGARPPAYACAAGDAVGVMAAQAVAKPATQMVLDVGHNGAQGGTGTLMGRLQVRGSRR